MKNSFDKLIWGAKLSIGAITIAGLLGIAGCWKEWWGSWDNDNITEYSLDMADNMDWWTVTLRTTKWEEIISSTAVSWKLRLNKASLDMRFAELELNSDSIIEISATWWLVEWEEGVTQVMDSIEAITTIWDLNWTRIDAKSTLVHDLAAWDNAEAFELYLKENGEFDTEAFRQRIDKILSYLNVQDFNWDGKTSLNDLNYNSEMYPDTDASVFWSMYKYPLYEWDGEVKEEILEVFKSELNLVSVVSSANWIKLIPSALNSEIQYSFDDVNWFTYTWPIISDTEATIYHREIFENWTTSLTDSEEIEAFNPDSGWDSWSSWEEWEGEWSNNGWNESEWNDDGWNNSEWSGDNWNSWNEWNDNWWNSGDEWNEYENNETAPLPEYEEVMSINPELNLDLPTTANVPNLTLEDNTWNETLEDLQSQLSTLNTLRATLNQNKTSAESSLESIKSTLATHAESALSIYNNLSDSEKVVLDPDSSSSERNDALETIVNTPQKNHLIGTIIAGLFTDELVEAYNNLPTSTSWSDAISSFKNSLTVSSDLGDKLEETKNAYNWKLVQYGLEQALYDFAQQEIENLTEDIKETNGELSKAENELPALEETRKTHYNNWLNTVDTLPLPSTYELDTRLHEEYQGIIASSQILTFTHSWKAVTNEFIIWDDGKFPGTFEIFVDWESYILFDNVIHPIQLNDMVNIYAEWIKHWIDYQIAKKAKEAKEEEIAGFKGKINSMNDEITSYQNIVEPSTDIYSAELEAYEDAQNAYDEADSENDRKRNILDTLTSKIESYFEEKDEVENYTVQVEAKQEEIEVIEVQINDNLLAAGIVQGNIDAFESWEVVNPNDEIVKNIVDTLLLPENYGLNYFTIGNGQYSNYWDKFYSDYSREFLANSHVTYDRDTTLSNWQSLDFTRHVVLNISWNWYDYPANVWISYNDKNGTPLTSTTVKVYSNVELDEWKIMHDLLSSVKTSYELSLAWDDVNDAVMNEIWGMCQVWYTTAINYLNDSASNSAKVWVLDVISEIAENSIDFADWTKDWLAKWALDIANWYIEAPEEALELAEWVANTIADTINTTALWSKLWIASVYGLFDEETWAYTVQKAYDDLEAKGQEYIDSYNELMDELAEITDGLEYVMLNLDNIEDWDYWAGYVAGYASSMITEAVAIQAMTKNAKVAAAAILTSKGYTQFKRMVAVSKVIAEISLVNVTKGRYNLQELTDERNNLRYVFPEEIEMSDIILEKDWEFLTFMTDTAKLAEIYNLDHKTLVHVFAWDWDGETWWLKWWLHYLPNVEKALEKGDISVKYYEETITNPRVSPYVPVNYEEYMSLPEEKKRFVKIRGADWKVKPATLFPSSWTKAEIAMSLVEAHKDLENKALEWLIPLKLDEDTLIDMMIEYNVPDSNSWHLLDLYDETWQFSMWNIREFNHNVFEYKWVKIKYWLWYEWDSVEIRTFYPIK